MAEPKTKPTKASVAKFINSIENPKKRSEAKVILGLFKEVTGLKPVMWGTSIIGFGSYHYKSERSKQEGDWPLTGFSPRKQNFSLYIMSGFKGNEALLTKLGPHKHSVVCLYIQSLERIHIPTLKKMIRDSVKIMKKRDGAVGC